MASTTATALTLATGVTATIDVDAMRHIWRSDVPDLWRTEGELIARMTPAKLDEVAARALRMQSLQEAGRTAFLFHALRLSTEAPAPTGDLARAGSSTEPYLQLCYGTEDPALEPVLRWLAGCPGVLRLARYDPEAHLAQVCSAGGGSDLMGVLDHLSREQLEAAVRRAFTGGTYNSRFLASFAVVSRDLILGRW